jgi:hypothetical protein
MLRELKASFKKVTTGVARELPSKADWKGDELISTYTEACPRPIRGHRAGGDQPVPAPGVSVEEFDLQRVSRRGPGCGPAMSAVLISEIDITSHHVSSL